MARKTRVEENVELFEAGPDEIDDVIAGIGSGDGAIINLFRLNPQGAPAFIGEIQPSDFSLEGIKNSYGGGKYKYIGKGNGSVRQGFFTIDGDPIGPNRGQVKPIYKRYINGKLVYSKPEDAELVINPPQAERERTSSDPLMMMFLAELRDLKTKLDHPVDTETIKANFLKEMVIFKELFAAPVQQNPTADMSKMVVDLIKQGMEVATLTGEGGNASPWMMILDKVLPTVQDALKVVAIQQQRSVVRQPQAIENQAMPSNGSQPPLSPVPLTGFDSIADKLRPYLPTFLSAASNGTDPAVLIDLTYPQIPPPEHSKIIAWLESTEWFSDLCKLHPIIVGQRAWWQEFRDGLMETIKNPEGIEDHETETI